MSENGKRRLMSRQTIVESPRNRVAFMRQPIRAVGGRGARRCIDGLDQCSSTTAAAGGLIDVQILQVAGPCRRPGVLVIQEMGDSDEPSG